MIHYRVAAVGSHKVFYREAGDADRRALLLLHGVLPCSHMLRLSFESIGYLPGKMSV
jgi:pimeloyl-ACP methyl ester carboxylesterase